MEQTRVQKLRLPAPVAAIMSVVLAFTLLCGVTACAPDYSRNIGSVESNVQYVQEVPTTNYSYLLADNVNWDSLSSADREGTARHAVNEAKATAEKAGVSYFNVLGLATAERTLVFFYSGEGQITMYVKGEPVQISL